MNVTDIKSRTVKTYYLTLEGGEIRPHPARLQGRRYRVTRVEVTTRDGNTSGVKLRGTVLKEDGSDSRLGCEEFLYLRGEWPEWLRGVIKGLA